MTTESPEQNATAPVADIVGDGELLTEVVIVFEVAVQLFKSVVVTLNVPVAVAVSVSFVELLFQTKDAKFALLPITKLTDPPVQNVVGPSAVIAGTSGVFSVI